MEENVYNQLFDFSFGLQQSTAQIALEQLLFTSQYYFEIGAF